MSKGQMLRALVKQRLSLAAEEIFDLFERTIAEYEEQLCRSKEENERQRKLLDAVFKPQLRLHRAGDVQQLSLSKEEVPPDQQAWSSSLNQEDPPELPLIKEEQEELWTNQEEADITKFRFLPASVESDDDDDDEEKPQSSQLHQRQTEQLETEADGEDCGGPEPARNSNPVGLLQPETTDCFESQTVGWKKTREPPSSNSLKNEGVSVGDKKSEKPLSCSECGKRFSRTYCLNVHKRIHTGEKPFSCSDCGKRFTQRSNLIEHMRHHGGQDMFNCLLCGKQFSFKYRLENHMISHTGEKPISCSICGRGFRYNGELIQHMRIHSGEKPFSCAECHKTFRLKISLDNHMKVHSGDLPVYSCTVCSQGFRYKVELNEHMKTHSEEPKEKPFSCSVCHKAFCQEYTLKTHMKIHSGEAPYTCPVCHKVCRVKSILDTHLMVHTGETPFTCEVCGKGFSQKGNMRKHMRLHTEGNRVVAQWTTDSLDSETDNRFTGL